MVLVRGGNTCMIAQDGRQAVLGAAEFALYDTRRPYEVACGTSGDQPTQMMTFMFSPALLPLSRRQIGQLAALPFPASAGLGDLTAQFLLQLARNVDHYRPAEAARLSAAALEVLATRLAHELDLPRWGEPEARRHALLTTVQAFINQHLGDPALTPAAIAAAHDMSLRSLHQLFHDEGLTVAGWTRLRRLERCRRDLADPALAARPVAAIAARWGFPGAASSAGPSGPRTGCPRGSTGCLRARPTVLRTSPMTGCPLTPMLALRTERTCGGQTGASTMSTTEAERPRGIRAGAHAR